MALRATGAATASRLFNEALAKIAMNAQQSGTGDIGKTAERGGERELERDLLLAFSNCRFGFDERGECEQGDTGAADEYCA